MVTVGVERARSVFFGGDVPFFGVSVQRHGTGGSTLTLVGFFFACVFLVELHNLFSKQER